MELPTVIVLAKNPNSPAFKGLRMAGWPRKNYIVSSWKSKAELYNTCVSNSPTETVLICDEQVLPTRRLLETLTGLLDHEYYKFSLVAAEPGRLFGLRKELFRKIGFFDETFKDDQTFTDMIVRLRNSNNSYYEGLDVNFSGQPFKHTCSGGLWDSKWDSNFKQKTNTIKLKYQLDEPKESLEYLPWDVSHVKTQGVLDVLFENNPDQNLIEAKWKFIHEGSRRFVEK